MPEPADFEAMYAASPDPFGVASTWYEQRKQQVLLACLTRPEYALAWDCASGTGHLARVLAARCDQVLASDASPAAVTLTTDLTAALDNVRCEVAALPQIPAGAEQADLTVPGEVLYYLPATERARTLAVLGEQHGEIATVHWRHHPHDAHLSGAAVTDELDAALQPRWRRVVRHEDEDFVAAVWLRQDGPT